MCPAPGLQGRPRQPQGFRHGFEIGFQQNDIGRFARDIARPAYRDAQIRLGQRRGIIDAIAHKGDPFALPLESLHQFGLLFGPDLRKNVGLRNSGLLRDAGCRDGVVAADEERLETGLLKTYDHTGGSGFEGILHGDQSEQGSVRGYTHDGGAPA